MHIGNVELVVETSSLSVVPQGGTIMDSKQAVLIIGSSTGFGRLFAYTLARKGEPQITKGGFLHERKANDRTRNTLRGRCGHLADVHSAHIGTKWSRIKKPMG